MRKLQKLCLGFAFGVSSAAQAALPAVQHVTCPAQLPDGAIRSGSAPDGWTPYLRGPFFLEFAAPTGGPPEQDAELADYRTTYTKTARINTYDFHPPNPGGIWMKCAYGPLGDLSLHKRLDDRIEQCRVTISNAAPRKVDIQCK